ncbi:hypothetical protein QYF36_001810 [Acer negundo]|nr:hypothetical protein QYF36_001810 [Acer negundo]
MESTKPEIDYEFLPMLCVYKDGHVERLMDTDFVPAVSNDPITGVLSKDITIVQEPNNNNIDISARLYLPKLTTTTQKFPLLVYFHGGGFCISSPFTSKYHNYVNALGSDPIGSKSLHSGSAAAGRLWPLICPSNPDNDDPRVNPVVEGGPSLVGLGCKRALVCVAENDVLKDRDWVYYSALSKCGWIGVVEIFETDGENHWFHLNDLQS